jgi:hypothetical protein
MSFKYRQIWETLRIYFLFGFLNLVSFVSTLKLKFVLGVGDGIA